MGRRGRYWALPGNGRWTERARLMRALTMLASGAAVTTIALDLGYENVSAFIAMFRLRLAAPAEKRAKVDRKAGQYCQRAQCFK
ncbi:hypothetical protein SBC1_20430 [Caballeronia sp. SBC1]|uniref:helix-turn-helix domain-containing protein n=2 Tax=unclassified Caballeronia TaxID=2646786 RepID=UPI0013E13332|nr:hypothetical protein SBC2_21810 [Caballeronia sp. SBC2]QIN62046.1 hypothetical protein SBC1_20430 [Caballeronia sp. SBC1]